MQNVQTRGGVPSSRLPELDAMRGVAAFLVLVHHALRLADTPYPFGDPLADRIFHTLMHFSPLRVLEFGRGPVLFFFVLSGYVLTRALLRGGSPGLLAFAVQRSARLMLPVAASVLLSAALYFAVVDPSLLQGPLWERRLHLWAEPPNLPAALQEMALLQTDTGYPTLNPVLWSLVHEWRLTLFLPLVLLFRGRVWSLLALAAAMTALGVLGGANENAVHLGPQLHSTVVASFYFALGIGSGAALALAGPLPPLTAGQCRAAGLAAVALLGLEADLAAYLASVLLILLAQQPGRFRQFLRRGPLVWLGKVSFSLYLVHAPVMVAWLFLFYGRLPLWVILVSGLPVALLASAVMHRLVEAPSRDLARWLERRLARRPHRAGATTESPAGHGLG